MLADRMMRREKCAKAEAGHRVGVSSVARFKKKSWHAGVRVVRRDCFVAVLAAMTRLAAIANTGHTIIGQLGPLLTLDAFCAWLMRTRPDPS
jgi:hypothetical protein